MIPNGGLDQGQPIAYAPGQMPGGTVMAEAMVGIPDPDSPIGSAIQARGNPMPSSPQYRQEIHTLQMTQAHMRQEYQQAASSQTAGFEHAARNFEVQARDVAQVEVASARIADDQRFRSSEMNLQRRAEVVIREQHRSTMTQAQKGMVAREGVLVAEAEQVIATQHQHVIHEAQQVLQAQQLHQQMQYEQYVSQAEGDLERCKEEVKYEAYYLAQE
jgi:hypothetical protein